MSQTTPRRVALLSTDDLSAFVTYDHLTSPGSSSRRWRRSSAPRRASPTPSTCAVDRFADAVVAWLDS